MVFDTFIIMVWVSKARYPPTAPLGAIKIKQFESCFAFKHLPTSCCALLTLVSCNGIYQGDNFT
jgi:hypothetical protein